MITKNTPEHDLVRIVAALAMVIEDCHCDGGFKVQIKRNPGLSSFGRGETRGEAIYHAMQGQNIHWESVAEKMRDKDVADIMHL